jgi:hypothetical protein
LVTSVGPNQPGPLPIALMADGQGMEVTVGKASRPSDETGVERLSWAVDIGRVDPAATGFQDMNDAADNPAIIDAKLR